MKGGALSHADIADQLQRAGAAQATPSGSGQDPPYSTCSASLAGRNLSSQNYTKKRLAAALSTSHPVLGDQLAPSTTTGFGRAPGQLSCRGSNSCMPAQRLRKALEHVQHITAGLRAQRSTAQHHTGVTLAYVSRGALSSCSPVCPPEHCALTCSCCNAPDVSRGCSRSGPQQGRTLFRRRQAALIALYCAAGGDLNRRKSAARYGVAIRQAWSQRWLFVER